MKVGLILNDLFKWRHYNSKGGLPSLREEFASD